MFSASDVRSLLDALPQSTTSSEHLFIQTAASESLVSLATVQADLYRLVNDRQAVTIAQLQSLLGIKDVTPLLAWADEQECISTPQNRRPWLPPWIQKTVAIHFAVQARYGFTSAADLHNFWHLPIGLIEDILEAYSPSFPPLIELGKHVTSPAALRASKASLEKLCRASELAAAPVNLSTRRSKVPEYILRLLLQQLPLSQQYEIEETSEGVWFVPTEAMALQNQSHQQSLLADYSKQLADQGYCVIGASNHNIDDLINNIEGQGGKRSLIRLEKHDQIKVTDWEPEGRVVLATQQDVTETVSTLLSSVMLVASKTWTATRDTKVVFSPVVIESFMESTSSASALSSLILRSTASSPIRTAYSQQLSILADDSQATFYTELRRGLYIPLNLYMATLPLCQDTAHQTNQAAFLLAYFKSDAIPAALDALSPDTPTLLKTELSRFRTTAIESQTLGALQSAAKRLMRKCRPADVESDGDIDERLRVRDAALEERLSTLMRAKRASDVLQQATWILLSAIGEGATLWMGSGKDAGRLLKVLRRIAPDVPPGKTFDWMAATEQLESYRAAIKRGTETADDTQAVRELASRGYAARRRRAMSS